MDARLLVLSMRSISVLVSILTRSRFDRVQQIFEVALGKPKLIWVWVSANDWLIGIHACQSLRDSVNPKPLDKCGIDLERFELSTWEPGVYLPLQVRHGARFLAKIQPNHIVIARNDGNLTRLTNQQTMIWRNVPFNTIGGNRCRAVCNNKPANRRACSSTTSSRVSTPTLRSPHLHTDMRDLNLVGQHHPAS